jgi:2',3'-cyclic-nucleotide 2'-phosphodiesterase/3'-nucleotidase
MVTLQLTGAEIADWLERSVAIFRQVRAGSTDCPLHDPSVPAFVFEVIPELSYAVDLSRPARYDGQGALIDPEARRITGLCYRDRLVEPGQEFLLVTNNHRAGRMRLHAPTREPSVVFTDGARVQSVIAAHVQDRARQVPMLKRNWHFLPMPGTTVSIATGPGAKAHLAEIAGYRPVMLGTDAEGFTHYRLHL